MAWLRETWRELSGVDVPDSAAVLLADELELWDERPVTPAGVRLWLRLRVAVLGAIWRLRCSRADVPAGQTFAHAAVSMAVATLTTAIERDWLRTHTDMRSLDDGNFCTDWWRGFDRRLTVDKFVEQWAQPATLCRVDRQAATGRPEVRVLVSRDTPVLWPP